MADYFVTPRFPPRTLRVVFLAPPGLTLMITVKCVEASVNSPTVIAQDHRHRLQAINTAAALPFLAPPTGPERAASMYALSFALTFASDAIFMTFPSPFQLSALLSFIRTYIAVWSI
jgi:hypothetical protein